MHEHHHQNHQHEHQGKHKGHSLSMFAQRFWVSLILTIPVILYSELPKKFLGFMFPAFSGSQYLSLILGTIVFFYGGLVFLTSAWSEIKARLPGMMTLIALAISTAYLYSVYAVLTQNKHTLFWELVTLITIMLLGHWLEMRAVQGAKGALKELSKLLPDKAEIIINQKLETKIVDISELKVNTLILVRPGGKIPTDGVVLEGGSDVNESMMTGESQPVKKEKGSEVIAGTINGDGALKIKVTKIGEQTFLAGVMRLVAEAESSKSRLQMLSDKAAFYLTIVAVAGGIITFLVWALINTPSFALERTVAVLVIACPHALGLAIPLVASISTALAAKNGFLVRERLSLEIARKVKVVLFDKTGTLTTGEYGVDKIIPRNSIRHLADKTQILQLAASIDARSEHFVAKAIVNEAKKEKINFLTVTDFKALPGVGVKGKVKNKEVIIGGLAALEKNKIFLPADFKKEIQSENEKGKTIVFVISKGDLLGAISLSDQIRPESKEVILDLKKLGIKTAMLTGDSEEVAQWVAKELKIDNYFARVLPGDKANIVKKIQFLNSKHAPTFQYGALRFLHRSEALNSKQIPNSNDKNSKPFRIFPPQWDPPLSGVTDFELRDSRSRRVVAAVGDGINDAPMLTQADLGVAIGAGTNVAIESAGIILVKNDPRDIVKIIKLSRATFAKMLQNLFWATGYNVVALPLAAGVLVSRGILLQPALAAILMSLSTIIVAINAALLRRLRLG